VDHGDEIAASEQVWIAALGPDSAPIGEASTNQTIYQKQLAATFASLLGFEFTANHPVGFQIASIRSAIQQTVMAKPVYHSGNTK
jgi:hypothetical protein